MALGMGATKKQFPATQWSPPAAIQQYVRDHDLIGS
jgi:hypothetical protein